MARASRSISSNKDLTRGDFVVARDGQHRSALKWAAAVLALLLIAGAGVSYFESNLKPALFLSDVRAENARLQEALGKQRLELEVELATRSELERQVADLREQLRRANDELAFLKSAGGRTQGR